MNDLTQFLKRMETASSELIRFEKALRPVTESLQRFFSEIDPNTVGAFLKGCQLISEHKDALQFLREDVSLEEIFSVIVKTPKEECDDELLRLFGIPELEDFKEEEIASLLPKFFTTLILLFRLWGFLMTVGITNLTFVDFVSELLNAPVQTIQKAHKNPSIPDGFNKNVKIIGRRDKKHKECGK